VHWLHREIGAELVQLLAGNPLGYDSIKPIGIILGFNFLKSFEYFITAKLVYYKTLKCIEDLRDSDTQTVLDVKTLDDIYHEMEREVGSGLLTRAENLFFESVMILKKLLKRLI
jgi:hypothetical protein